MIRDRFDVLERFEPLFEAPEPSFERFRRRRDRKRRNQRITAGVAGFAVFVSAIWLVTAGGPAERMQTPGATGPAVTGPAVTGPAAVGPTNPGLGPVSDEDIALGEAFSQAWLAGDGGAAAALFSPEGTFDGFPPAILPALHDWFRAGGWTFESEGRCGVGGFGPERGYVGCDWLFENDLTRAVGLQPQHISVHFVTDAGGITTALSNVFEVGIEHWADDLFGDVWDMFIEWLSSSHPEDFVRMYDTDRGYPILDPDSIALWERYTDEFAALLPGSFTEWEANQSLEVRARRICVRKTQEFWETEGSGRDLHGRAFDTALADVSEEILTELRALPLGTDADRATMDAFVPLAQQWIEFFRQAAAGQGPADSLNARKALQFSMGELIDGCLISYGLLG